MGAASSVKESVKRLLLGDKTLPQQVTVAICEPQDEVAVWLHGGEVPRDVTYLHSIACASPFTVCIPFEGVEEVERQRGGDKMSLELRERRGAQRLLGKIRLRYDKTIPVGESCLGLFKAKSCVNYCMPRVRFWAHYLQQGYWRWRDGRVPNVRMA